VSDPRRGQTRPGPVRPGAALPGPVELIRPLDLAVVRFSFVRLTLTGGRSPRLVGPGAIIATFPPQHMLERAFLEVAAGFPIGGPGSGPDGDPDASATTSEPVGVPVAVRLAGPSRLVFDVSADVAIPFTAEALLAACATLPLRVAAHAVAPRAPLVIGPGLSAGRVGRLARGARLTAVTVLHRRGVGADRLLGRAGASVARGPTGPPSAPGAQETAIELPYRLLLSPHRDEGFTHSAAPISREGRVELWHTRLTAGRAAGPDDEGTRVGRSVRALWTRDFDELTGARPDDPVGSDYLTDPRFASVVDDEPAFRTSLSPGDRMAVVHETADFALPSFTPPAIPVRRLMLSALGGWLDSRLTVTALPAGYSLSEWRHRATLGRDHEVRVVHEGFLFPFGHQAALVKVTERRFDPEVAGNPAVLFQRMFVVVRQEERSYGHELLDIDGRIDLRFPFTSVRVKTRVTPLLDDPPATHQTLETFVAYVAGRPFRFGMSGVDLNGRTIEWAMPLWFVDRTANETTRLHALIDVHEHVAIVADTRATTRIRAGEAPLGRQRVALAAESADSEPDATTAEVDSAVFSARAPAALAAAPPDEPRFAPVLASARVVLPAVARVTGRTEPVEVSYAGAYARHGFEPTGNRAEVFLARAATGAATAVRFDSTERAGGLVNPSFTIGGVSRRHGPVGGDAEQAAANGLDPTSFFDLADAKLFGLVSLADLLDPGAFAAGGAPQFAGQSLSTVDALLSDLELIRTASSGVRGATALATAATRFANQVQASVGGGPAPEVSALANALTAFDPAAAGASVGQSRLLGTVLARAKAGVGRPDFADELSRYARHEALPKVDTGRLVWRPRLRNGPGGIFQPDDPDKCLTVVVDRRSDPEGGGGDADVTCTLENFKVELVPGGRFLELNFERLEVVLAAGRSPDVKATFKGGDDGIKFVGSLSFVEKLKSLIPLDGFSDPPDLDATSDGISASYSLALPDIALGVLSLENLSLGASLKIPFVGRDPVQAAFNFCTRDNPFILTVSFIGGGGFFGLTVTPSGIQVLEAAFEFGADIAVNFGVASGGVSVTAGIYYRLERRAGALQSSLTGYFRMRGEVSVLGGLFSASIELYLSLTYQEVGKVKGRAELTIEVHIIFFSVSVTIAVEKRFSGRDDDPSFVELMDGGAPGSRPWDEYCLAFGEA
jgi:hypothetical protein